MQAQSTRAAAKRAQKIKRLWTSLEERTIYVQSLSKLISGLDNDEWGYDQYSPLDHPETTEP